MIKTDELIDRLRDFVEDHKILSVAIIIGIVIILISIVLVVGISSGTKKKKVNTVDSVLTIEDDFVPPQDYTMTEDYYFSRQTDDSWPQEEVDRWFAVPSTPVMDELRKDNNSIVEEILGAAP
ncbi:MAG: hypothetical protein II584_03290 [Treponema sp.]|nr:hypothetical protein [Treponema sp.]